nr:nitroreductase family protein [uncultured Stomatobaculum sp.]
MDFLELARARYSCRKLTNAPVAAEKLERILEAARVAPTAKNLQPYRLFLLESRRRWLRSMKSHPVFSVRTVF